MEDSFPAFVYTETLSTNEISAKSALFLSSSSSSSSSSKSDILFYCPQCMSKEWASGPRHLLFSDATFPMGGELLVAVKLPEGATRLVSICLDEAFGRAGTVLPTEMIHPECLQFLETEYTFSGNARTLSKRAKSNPGHDMYEIKELVLYRTTVPVVLGTSAEIAVDFFTNRYPLHHTIVVFSIHVYGV